MKSKSAAVPLLLLLMFLCTEAVGQTLMRGVVKDSASGEVVVGANVFLVGTAFGTTTGIDGSFFLAGVPDGQYTVRVSCLGYSSSERTMVFESGQTYGLEVFLPASVILGEEVVVTGQLRGQMAAINQQVNSSTIMSVVSEEKIQELPDANAASAIGRLSGVSLTRSGGEASQVVLRGLSSKFSSITIDGVRIPPTAANDRGIDMSTLSQSSLAGIELFKALTPDKDADAIAGSVNLVTRKAPEEGLLRFDVRGNYNGLDKSASQYNVGGRYGSRFMDGKLGVQLIGNAEKTIRSNETTNHDWLQTILPPPTNFTDYEVSEFNVTYENEFRKRRGGSLLLDFESAEFGSIRFNNVFNETSRDYINHNRNYHWSGGVAYEYRDRITDISTFSSSVRGENFLFGFETEWSLAFSESRVDNPYDYTFAFTESSSTSGDSSGMGFVPNEYKKGPVEFWIPYAFNNFTATVADRATDRSSRNYDRERTAFLNLKRTYSLTDYVVGEVKFGGKYRGKGRTYTVDESIHTIYLYAVGPYVLRPDSTFAPKDFSGTRFDGLVGVSPVSFANFLDPNPPDRDVYGRYRLYPLINRHDLRLWRSLNINGYKAARTSEFGDDAEYRRNVLVDADRYSLTEGIFAWYAMNSLNFGSFATLMTGLRLEYDDNDYIGTYTPLPLSGFIFAQTNYSFDKEVNHKETTILPNVQLILRPFEFLNIRTAAYKALARPDFNHRLPKFVVRSASGNSLQIGNPGLKNAEATNFEVQTQVHGDNIGLFSVAAFYKNVKNMFHSINGISINSDSVFVYGKKVARGQVVDELGVDWRLYTNNFPFTAADYTLTYRYNSTQPTKVWGIEVEHQPDLRFLPGILKNLVLSYNFTVVRSETFVTTWTSISTPNPRPGRPPISNVAIVERKQRLEDQPEFFLNGSAGYDIAGFSIRVSYFYQGQYNRTFSSDSYTDGVTDPYSRWDVAVRQRVSDNLSFVLNAQNISNTHEGTMLANRVTGWNLLDVSNRYGSTIDFGIRLEF